MTTATIVQRVWNCYSFDLPRLLSRGLIKEKQKKSGFSQRENLAKAWKFFICTLRAEARGSSMNKTIYGENNLPYIRIWIHLIWSTKNRERIINKEIKNKLLNHIRENAKSKNIYIDFINSEPEHVHATISLGSDQTISKVAQLIKGESSNWINKHKLLSGHFEWQDEYIALSISESQINKVRDYIKNQEEHHRKKSFAEEYEEFIEKYGFNKYTK